MVASKGRQQNAEERPVRHRHPACAVGAGVQETGIRPVQAQIVKTPSGSGEGRRQIMLVVERFIEKQRAIQGRTRC